MLIHNIKKFVEKVSGYWIYKRKHLPTGVDSFIDIRNRYELGKSPVFFDVGANIGQTVVSFKRLYPDSKIYAFEPVQSTYFILKKAVKNFSNTTVENIALGAKTEQLEINLNENSQLNSLNCFGANEKKTEMVDVDTLDKFAAKNKIEVIDFLKTDTEGFDLKVLEGASELLKKKKIKFIYSEIGIYKSDLRHSNLFEISEFLKHYGYYLLDIYDLRHHGEGRYGNALFFSDHLNMAL